MSDEITKPSGALRFDVNGDGQFTVSDLPVWLSEAFFLPGDWLIWLTMRYAAPVAGFLELDTDDYGSVLSGSLSGLVWLALVMILVVAYRAVHNVDRALTSAVSIGYSEGGRRLRIGTALLRQRLRRARELERPASAHETIEFARDAELSEDELRALQLHGEVEAGYALALDEVAAALGRGRGETHEILSRLIELRFLHRTLGGYEGEAAYKLTRAGRAYLSFRVLGGFDA